MSDEQEYNPNEYKFCCLGVEAHLRGVLRPDPSGVRQALGVDRGGRGLDTANGDLLRAPSRITRINDCTEDFGAVVSILRLARGGDLAEAAKLIQEDIQAMTEKDYRHWITALELGQYTKGKGYLAEPKPKDELTSD